MVEYDSNAAFLSDDLAEPVWRGVLTPGYRWVTKSDTQELELDAEIRLQQSSDTTISFNRQDPRASITWRHRGPRSELALDTLYSESSTRITEFQDSGLLLLDGTRTEASAGIDWEYRLSERLTFGTQGRYVDESFEDAGPFLTGFESVTAGLTLTFLVSPRLQPYLQAGYTRQEPEQPDSGLFQAGAADLYYAGVGVNAQLSQRWSVETDASAIRLEMDDAEPSMPPDSGPGMLPAGSDWNANVSLVFEGERLNFSLSAGRATAPGGVGGFIDSESLSASASYPLGERTQVGVNSSLLVNGEPLGNELRSASLWVERSLSRAWRLRIDAAYREETGIFDTKGTLVSLSLAYEIPRP
jgi:hypothetical protein